MRIQISSAEREKQLPLVDTLERATAEMRKTGWVLFDDALDVDYIRAVRRAFFERHGADSEEELLEAGIRVGHERFMFAPELEPPFFDARLYANPFVLSTVRALLGDDCVLDSYVFVVAYPGAEAQHLHLDHSLLFPESEVQSMAIPPYALTMVVPLVDLGSHSGSTRVFDLSARAEPSLVDRIKGGTVVEAKMGSAWLMDYRVPHGGTPNPSAMPRPILYVVYARKWFLDADNFRSRPAMLLDRIEDVPEAYRSLIRPSCVTHPSK